MKNQQQYMVTHDGAFQADEVFSAAVLTTVFPELPLYRTRDPAVIETAMLAFDVGGRFDIETFRFDHHQPEGAGTRPPRNPFYSGIKIPYSSAGLIWKYFASNYLELQNVPEELINYVWNQIDKRYVEPIDRVDNGIRCDNDTGWLRQTIARFTPPYGERTMENYESAFWEAVTFTKERLAHEVRCLVAFQKGIDRFKKIHTVLMGGKIIVCNEDLPWRPYTFHRPEVLFVISPTAEEGKWSANGVRVNRKDFDIRCSFISEWGGLRDTKLEEVSGIEGAVFCHRGLNVFIATSKEACIKACVMAVEKENQNG